MVTRWTPEYLAQLAGERNVEVVIGERESRQAKYETMPLATVFRRQLDEAGSSREPIYLKEFNLLGEFPVLTADVDLARLRRPRHRSWHRAWISDRGGRTGYHYDLLDNVLVQIRGHKIVTMVAPEHARDMYPSTKHDVYATVSEVDGFAPDLNRHPRFAAARRHEEVFELLPGDAIYIPTGWWHRVESMTSSISLAGFMASAWDFVRLGPEHLRQALHQAGLYKRGHCSCHRTS